MNVLITSTDLHQRGGVQTYVRMLARGLEKLGHSVMAYGSDLGDGERLLQYDPIPVTTDLENLPVLPDIIHAQHHLDGMTALSGLPSVPAIYHCHGASWRMAVIKHPRVYRYLTVSRTLAGRLTIESNIPPSDIDVVLNGVEVVRFAEVRALPDVMKKALFYNSRHLKDSPTVAAVGVAAARMGLTLDHIGYNFGNHTDRPEDLLPQYDVVFASGVSALEALMCGCAVIVLGRTSCGPLVRLDNFDQLRQTNLSIASNAPPPSADAIEAELRLYSRAECAAVAIRARREADFADTVSRLVSIYQDAIDRHRTTAPDPRAEMLAVSRYLRRIVPLIKATDDMMGRVWSSGHRSSSLDDLTARVILLEQLAKRTQ